MEARASTRRTVRGQAAPAVLEYHGKEGALTVLIEGMKFKVDLSASASKNADNYYSKSKKAKTKLKGARGAAEKTRTQIRDYVEKVGQRVKRRRGCL